jgi:hypothetical protein
MEIAMNTQRELVLKAVIALALPTIWTTGIGTAQAGPPRNASATVSRTGPAGNTSTRQSAVASNGQGGYTAGSTVTGPAGNTAARQQSGSYNPATKTYTRQGTTTGPNGNTSSFNSSIQATGNGYDRTATHTGPNGKSVTSTGQATYNPATGTVNQSRATTGPNGNSATENRSVTVTPAQ